MEKELIEVNKKLGELQRRIIFLEKLTFDLIDDLYFLSSDSDILESRLIGFDIELVDELEGLRDRVLKK